MRRQAWGFALAMFALAAAPAMASAASAPSAPPTPTVPADRDRRDARLLYCLDPANTAALVGTAVTLGLARPGDQDGRLSPRLDPTAPAAPNLTIQQWRAQRHEEFDRACAALVASRSLPSARPAGDDSGGGGMWATLIPVIVGAVAAGFFGEFRAGRALAGVLAGAVHTKASDYQQACESYLNQWTADPFRGTPPDEVLRQRLALLDAELKRTNFRHPAWKVPNLIRGELRAATREMTGTALSAGKPADRKDTAEQFRDRLELAHRNIMALVMALERPLLGSRAMRSDRLPHRPKARP